MLHNTRGKVVHTPALKKSQIARRMTQKRGSKTPANTGLLETWLQSPNIEAKPRVWVAQCTAKCRDISVLTQPDGNQNNATETADNAGAYNPDVMVFAETKMTDRKEKMSKKYLPQYKLYRCCKACLGDQKAKPSQE